MANSQLSGRCLIWGLKVAPAGRKAVGEPKTVNGLNTLDGNAFAGEIHCLESPQNKRYAALRRRKDAIAGGSVNGGILMQL